MKILWEATLLQYYYKHNKLILENESGRFYTFSLLTFNYIILFSQAVSRVKYYNKL